tara:strand:- start:107 stop:574 length:468 start_codon:yes stop_codon:yes gene_type:complete
MNIITKLFFVFKKGSFAFIFFLFSFYSFAEEYQLKVLGENLLKEINVDDEKLVLAETKFKWTDSDANFGKGHCLGNIHTKSDKNSLSFLCEFIDFEGEKFFTKIYRESSELAAGIGFQRYIKVSNKYTKLLNKECKYAVSWFDKTSFLMQQKCNL